MDREIDPRDEGRELPGLRRSGRGASTGPDARRVDPREVVVRDLDLPRGRSRERVRVHSRTFELRGSEVRALATVGAFRVVPTEDLREATGRRTDARTGDLYRLRQAGLVHTIPYGVGRDRTSLVVLTEQGREVLESHRRPSDERAQVFYAGLVKPREVPHDSHIYRAYLRAADRLVSKGANIRRVVLDYELKRDYQRFLQQRNRTRRDPNADEWVHLSQAEDWARAHDLPFDDDHVQFPDVRIEFDHPDGRRDVEDVEVWTPHYRGAFAAAKAASGFTRYRSGGRGLIGARSGRRGGGSPDPRLAEEFLS
jgi:DNA-binding MarR family transcriptional regulator